METEMDLRMFRLFRQTGPHKFRGAPHFRSILQDTHRNTSLNGGNRKAASVLLSCLTFLSYSTHTCKARYTLYPCPRAVNTAREHSSRGHCVYRT